MRGASYALALLVLLATAGEALAEPKAGRGGFAALEGQVREFTLPNGLKFIVLERHDVPIFSYQTIVNAGAVDEVAGVTGIAHMFEHMAFKGTTHVGATDIEKESEVLDAVDAAYAALRAERWKRRDADPARLEDLEAAFKAAQAEADGFVVSNEFSKVLEEQGAQNLNAGTAADVTMYAYNLPSNRLELWALTESDRLVNPVLREFYKERDVVIEERSMRIESTPSGRLFENFVQTAFVAHPYGNGLVGHRSDLESFSRSQAEAFRKEHYVAKNMTIAVVGDVDAKQVEALAQKYFSAVSAAPAPPPVETVEPPQAAERRIVMEDEAQPLVFFGYHMPDLNDPDFQSYKALADIVGSGRSGRLYTSLVKEKKIAVQTFMTAGFPGEKYPNLMFGVLVPSAGVDPDSALALYDAEIARLLADKPITAEELDGFKTRAQADFWKKIGSNGGMAEQLSYYQMMTGDWRNLFREVDEVQAVTTEKVMEVARETLRKDNRTVAVLRNRAGSAS